MELYMDVIMVTDVAEEFLRKHDPLYKRKNRKKLLAHSYLSDRQVNIRAGKEIPLSNLSNKQRNKCPSFGDAHDYDE